MRIKDKKAVLLMDTADSSEIKVGLEIDGKDYFLKEKVKVLKAQGALPLIEKVLKKHNLNLGNIKAIKVNRGPGSFTGLRVGIAIANTLSSILKISINDKKLGEIEIPKY